jgi:hypothetical protein
MGLACAHPYFTRLTIVHIVAKSTSTSFFTITIKRHLACEQIVDIDGLEIDNPSIHDTLKSQ